MRKILSFVAAMFVALAVNAQELPSTDFAAPGSGKQIARWISEKTEGLLAPTINLDVNYIRPVEVGETLAVTAKATSTGRRITQLTAEARIKSTGKLAATASSRINGILTVLLLKLRRTAYTPRM